MVACKRICKCKHRASALNHSLRLEVKDPVLNINNNSMTLPMQLPITFELEVADQKNLAQTIGTSLRYKAVSDGSISGSSPREYIFGPYQGDNLLVSLLRIAEILNQVKPEVNSSCGLHVHVDSSELDGIALSKLLAVWLIMEKGILKYICTPNRSNNSMCRMMTQHNQPFIDTVRQTLTETDSGNIRRIIKADIYKNSLDPKTYKEIKERKKTIKVAGDVLNAEAARKYNGARYHTLNLHSHFFRGTVEFRCMHSTINPMVIGSWPLMCGWIVNQAYSLDPKELLMDIEDIRFGDTAAKLIKYTEKLCPAFISDWVKSYII